MSKLALRNPASGQATQIGAFTRPSAQNAALPEVPAEFLDSPLFLGVKMHAKGTSVITY